MWLGQGHSVLSVFVYTVEHSYGWAADGYYKEFSFYRDSQKILHFGNYAEKANEYVTLTMVRDGNIFSFYFNGNLINTYTEEDTSPSKVTSLALVSPWRGDAKYAYFQMSEPNAVVVPSNSSEVTSGFPLVPVLIGGGITAAVVGGVAVYYFFIAGGSSASAGESAGGSVGSAGGEGTGGSNEGGGSVIQEHPISPLSGETPVTNTLASLGASEGANAAQTNKPHYIDSVSGLALLKPEYALNPDPNGIHADLHDPTLVPEKYHGTITYSPEEAAILKPLVTITATNFGDPNRPESPSGSTPPVENAPNPQSSPSGTVPGQLVTITGTDFGKPRSANLTKAQTDSKTKQTEESSESKSTS